MIDRPYGLKRLWQWKDQEPIKVVTGIRRCGKSTLLSMFQGQLCENGIKTMNAFDFLLEKEAK